METEKLIWGRICQVGRGKPPRRRSPGRLSFGCPVGGADGRCSRRWCQTEIRGLGTAGRCFGCERYCCLQTSVTIDLGRIALWLIDSLQVGSLTAPTPPHRASQVLVAVALHGGQRPAPTRQLPGDRHVGHQGVLLPLGEALPPGVKTPVAGVSAGPQCGVHLGPSRP